MSVTGVQTCALPIYFFPVRVETPRHDAGLGLWLRGDGRGNFAPVSASESGVRVFGEQRGAALADYDGDGRIDLLVGQNAGPAKLFHNLTAQPGLRVRVSGPPGNPDGVGAVLRLKFGERLGPAREIHAGSGYWSQDSAVPVMGGAGRPTQIVVRWPAGTSTTNELSGGAREISVPAPKP